MKVLVSNIKNWIYVTGMGRSGTTFVGKVLSLPLQVDYIHEPFNPTCGLPSVTKWDRYIPADATPNEIEHDLLEDIRNIFTYNISFKKYVPEQDSPLKKNIKYLIGSRGPVYLRLAKLNPFHTAAVIKAPIGLFMTEYIFQNFQVKPVILVRHPVSIIASLRRVGWWPSLEILNDQPQLRDDFFADESDFLERTWGDPLLEIAAYWRAVYKVTLMQLERNPDWILLRHEDLSQAPIQSFKKLYHELSLPWSISVENAISKLTKNNSGEVQQGKVQDFKRKSSAIFELRRNSIPVEKRKQIFEIVEDIALKIYSRDSFAIDSPEKMM